MGSPLLTETFFHNGRGQVVVFNNQWQSSSKAEVAGKVSWCAGICGGDGSPESVSSLVKPQKARAGEQMVDIRYRNGKVLSYNYYLMPID